MIWGGSVILQNCFTLKQEISRHYMPQPLMRCHIYYYDSAPYHHISPCLWSCCCYPRPWVEGIVVCVCECLSVCVFPQNCHLNSIISKSKQATALKLINLRQKVDLYKTDKVFQASTARVANKFENKKLHVQIWHKKVWSQANGITQLET